MARTKVLDRIRRRYRAASRAERTAWIGAAVLAAPIGLPLYAARQYARGGKKGSSPAGLRPSPFEWITRTLARRDLKIVREASHKLLSLGLTKVALADLVDVATASKMAVARVAASKQLALWHLRGTNPGAIDQSREWIARARCMNPSPLVSRELFIAEMICAFHLGDRELADRILACAAAEGLSSPDLRLAHANLLNSPEERVRSINGVLSSYHLAPVMLMPQDGSSPYDRLESDASHAATVDGPLISVIVAAYDAADTLPTALRSLQAQSWSNFEVIVVDDCSPNDATQEIVEALSDDRFRSVRLDVNSGAYVARNRGLELARGKYVTLHDSDDWSHPGKLATQARHLERHPSAVGCMSEQARATSDLRFPRWAASGGRLMIIKDNVSSLMFRRSAAFSAVGYWDAVRFGADSDKIRRLQSHFGEGSITSLETGPLSFQRVSDSSAIASNASGYDGFLYGARLEYAEQQRHHRETVRYPSPSRVSFPVPRIMRPDRSGQATHYDVIIGSDFRLFGGTTRSSVEEVVAQKSMGLRTGLLPMYRYDFRGRGRDMIPEMRDQLAFDRCETVVFGEDVSCDLLLLRYPPILQHRQRYVPKIAAKSVKVIVNQPPMSDYGAEGVVRYDIETCDRNAMEYFGRPPVWHPIGPLVRDALHEHHGEQISEVTLSDQDWYNIIDVEEWARDRRPPAGDRAIRIGRHSRDAPQKWPERAEDILAAYPNDGSVDVRILGGAKSVRAVLSRVPSRWTVHKFGSRSPQEFLAELDVYIYFTHSEWVESFGRSIFEAMAVGVPVVLPEMYRPLFRDAALYATPQTARDVAVRLCGDPEAYDRQVELARAYVSRSFGYEMHRRRLREAGVSNA